MRNATKAGWFVLILLMVMCLFVAGIVCAEGTQNESSAAVTIGSTVTFGHYEQDNDPSNGAEEIEWIVLDVQGDKALLLSKYGLDSKQYNVFYVATTWEECTLRGWLNNEFLKASFDEKEQSAILITEVDNSPEQGNAEWADVESGNNTQDRIFLLSCAEASRYLGVTPTSTGNIKARVVPTAYAISHGAWVHYKYETEEGAGAGRWWLRSPGRYEYRAAHVIGDGSLKNTHVSADSDHYGGGVVRPALWVDLQSGVF